MKYQVGDLLLLKDGEYKPRLRPLLLLRLRLRLRPLLRPLLRLHLRPELSNSFGMVTQAIKHNDAWEGETTNDDNVYVWFSQLDAREYSFCEDEVIGEVIK
jgi:hypothetical protein